MVNDMRRIICALLMISFLVLSACNDLARVHSDSPPIRIVSLEENIGKLQEKANEWDADAYLQRVYIPIRLNGENVSRELIITFFQSPSKDHESLIVYLDPDGDIETKKVNSQKPIYHVYPITKQEWQIDSQEALNLLLDEDKTRLLKQSQLNCSELRLEHKDPRENSVVWILSIWDCGPDMSSEHYYLDPNTGEVDELIR